MGKRNYHVTAELFHQHLAIPEEKFKSQKTQSEKAHWLKWFQSLIG